MNKVIQFKYSMHIISITDTINSINRHKTVYFRN